MKLLLLLLVPIGVSYGVLAQVGIGTSTPDNDASLELKSTNKGLLLPRVALSSTTSPSPLTKHVAGMVVYNTATAGSGVTAVVPCFYINDGTQWIGMGCTTSTIVPNCGTYSVSFTYNGASVTYGTLASPTTGACFLDRNLGASAVATAYNDYNGYGDLFQWGRLADGHQLITWTNSTTGSAVNGTTSTLSSSDVPGNALFITNSNNPFDWRNPQNDNLWQGASGINNPCPSGWRLPTQSEWTAEAGITSVYLAYGQLKLTAAGYRRYIGVANLINAGSEGDYWSSTVSGTGVIYSYYTSTGSTNNIFGYRAYGYSVRCRK